MLGTLGAIMLLLGRPQIHGGGRLASDKSRQDIELYCRRHRSLEVIPKDWILSLPWSLRAALGLALFAFIFGAWFRAVWVLLLSDDANRNKAISVETHGVPDPKKWTSDPETGEYHRITFTNKDGSSTIRSTYADRRLKYLLELDELKKTRIQLVGYAIAALILGYLARAIWNGECRFCNAYSPLDSFLLMATGIGAVSCAVGVAVGFIIWITKEVARPLKKAEVGLPPIPPRGLEDVENQKVHGEGRFATPEEIDRAARGHGTAGGGFDDQTFHD